MRKYIIFFLLLFCYSGYYFPFVFKIFPLLNSKEIMAVIGLVAFSWNRFRYQNANLRIELLGMMLLAAMVSLWSYIATTYNNTTDITYVRYFMSMAAWLGGAYGCIYLTRKLYGSASIYIVFQLLAWMCAGHCILAVLIDNIPGLKDLIDNIFFTVSEYTEKSSRLYSFGVSYDTAGIRFSAVLTGIAYLIRGEKTTREYWIYIILYFIIAVIGCMMSRTTIVGIAISLVYIILTSNRFSGFIKYKTLRRLAAFSVFLVTLIAYVVYLYNTSPIVHSYFRYGFEGFFNLFEHGRWETHSSNLLFNALDHLPTNTKTWYIGDGYFDDPITGAFYMGIDMGYVRFIYYFGLIGLFIFILYFAYCAYTISLRDHKRKLFFFMMFVVQLAVWVKITTDIFCMFALLMLLNTSETQSDNKPIQPII